MSVHLDVEDVLDHVLHFPPVANGLHGEELGLVFNLDSAKMGAQGTVTALVFFCLNLVGLPQSANHVWTLGLSNAGDSYQVQLAKRCRGVF